jgi:hemerythrin-like domain-containing protein
LSYLKTRSLEPAKLQPPLALKTAAMRHLALDVIRDEHQALAAMLRSLQVLVQQARRSHAPPPFPVVRAMLFYIDEFPGRLHHPKESQLLFPRVRQHAPDLRAVLQRLEDDHAAGERNIREVEHALLAFEVMGEPRREAFETALERYITGYLEHMACEEREVLPAARRLFTEADWAELDAAFAANRDPLTGHPADEDYRALFRQIVNAAPAPVGLG